jgi:hypothetical protein
LLHDLHHLGFRDSFNGLDNFRGRHVARYRPSLHHALLDGLVDKGGVGSQVFRFPHDGPLPGHVHRLDHRLLHHEWHVFPHGLLNLPAYVFRVDVAVLVFVIVVDMRRIGTLMRIEERLGRLSGVMEAASATAGKFARLLTTAVRLFGWLGHALLTHAQEVWLIRRGPLSITVLIFRDQSAFQIGAFLQAERLPHKLKVLEGGADLRRLYVGDWLKLPMDVFALDLGVSDGCAGL